jgi:RNA polymerase sigma-70 factor (ECF subfamily)
LSYARALAGGDATARDLAQDAFVAAWQNVGKFDVTRDFGSWLRGIVRNKWREYCRLHARETVLDEAALVRLEATLAPHSEGDTALFARLGRCRDKLPPPLADAVRVFYDEELSGDEAATELQLNPATFRKRLERARAALRHCLTKEQTDN